MFVTWVAERLMFVELPVSFFVATWVVPIWLLATVVFVVALVVVPAKVVFAALLVAFVPRTVVPAD
jgi:hypothetical protein